MTGTPTTEVAAQLRRQFGLDSVELRYGLSQDELFHEAIANDRGRVHPDGPDDDQKAYPTALGVDGPLIYYTDPTLHRPPDGRHLRRGPPRGHRHGVVEGRVLPVRSREVRRPAPAGDRAPQRAQRNALRHRRVLRLGPRPSPSRTASSASTRPTRSSATSCSRTTSATTPTATSTAGRSSTCRRSAATPSATAPSPSAPSSWTSSTASPWSSAAPTTAASTRRRCSPS